MRVGSNPGGEEVERRRRHWTDVRTAALLVCLVAASYPAAGREDRPLPDRTRFIEEVRKRLRSDDWQQQGYTFRERRVRVDFDGDGRPRKRETKDFEIYPSVDGSPSYRRLLAVDGVPQPPARLAEADRKHREELEEWARDRRSEGPDAKARRRSGNSARSSAKPGSWTRSSACTTSGSSAANRSAAVRPSS